MKELRNQSVEAPMAAHSILLCVAQFNPNPVRVALRRFMAILPVFAMASKPNGA
jgi:hypothetical protein